MKALLLILLSLFVVNCGGKNWSTNTAAATDDTIQDDNTPDDNDDDNDDDDDDDNDDVACPRYDLVVKSTHSSNKKLNFKYTFNAEMTHTSVQGKHKIKFNKPQFDSCSGNYTNSSILASLIPLKATEDLTGEVLITSGQACSSSAREVTIQVFDAATNTALFDEAELKSTIGCEFGYTAEGEALRSKLINLADGVANAKGAACN